MKEQPKTSYLKDMLFGVIKWGKKGTGKMLSAQDISDKLIVLGFERVDVSHLGIFLNKNGYFSIKSWDSSKKTEDIRKDYERLSLKTHKQYFVEFLDVEKSALKQKIDKYNPIIKGLKGIKYDI